MSIKDLRTASGMSQSAFAAYFNIPLDSVQNWEQGRRKCPDYVVELIAYKLQTEKLIKVKTHLEQTGSVISLRCEIEKEK